ncbi:hypothetical protein Cni_G16837 [Canna indica]|uniref:non-specific serine/threonine protein kinase n=1 Tax=Canna indica TaxID=4628 RepID=A0AAQ3QH69_9LILI|nr:hypothetical protein Cni_G16837 [Canna indica]
MERLIVASTFLLYPLAATLFSTVAGSGDTLTLNQTLADDGGALVSAGGSFALGFFSPTGSTNRYIGIWYNKISVRTVVWVANRGQPVMDRQGKLSILANGTLVITDSSPTVVRLSSSSVAVSNPVAQLLDDGNFVVREAGSTEASDPNSFAWQSFDFPTDTVLPKMKLGWNLTTMFNRQLSSWTSATDPTPGEFTFGVDLRGDPQMFIWSRTSRQKWRGGPWNGLRFTGVPQMTSYNTFSLSFVVDDHQVVYSFDMLDPKFVFRLVLNPSGLLQRLVWIEQSKYWNVFWYSPIDQCDDFSPCGPNGICDVNNSPICSCLQGFRPNNPAKWGLRDGTDGCVRKTALDCRNGTNGFVLLRGAKLPDTSSSTVNWRTSLDECRAKCLRNCSCTAYAQANISGSGSGCITWNTNLTDIRVYDNDGQDLYVRLAAADLGTNSKHLSRSQIAMIVVFIALAIFSLAFVVFYTWKRKKAKTRTVSLVESHSDEGTEGKNLDLPLLDLDTITNATNNFSIENKLGEGGFGPVYKGNLGEEHEIAVKRLSKNSVQGLDEFKNEIILIAKLQHRNLVRLLGCCIQGEEKMLIYEYLQNGSLDSFLFDKAKATLLNWSKRCDIIVGIARGLLYLHEDSRVRIIHRDLKASNVLLDLDMNPKISDFGMARIFGGDETEVNTKRVVGTYGYMSPEYAMDGIFSVKSDAFSFGVLALEIISGKKNRGVYHSTQNMNLLGYTWSLWKEGRGLELVDELIGDSFPKAEVLKCINIGLLCVQERPEDRPTMSTVLLMLRGDNATIAHPRQPGFVAIRGPFETNSSSSKNDSLSINNISITTLEGVLGTVSLVESHTDEGTEGKNLDLPLLDLDTITNATNNFSIENKLGEGGFGPVYKGKLGEELEIAVKRLSKNSVQGLDEFKNEMILIAKLQHRNLVRLLGCCIHGEERMLIYEYLQNGSLDSFLFDKAKATLLNWHKRYNIIVGIARGLVYLHEDSRLRIIHRDLKASNILLDLDMNPKISDFGMARIFGGDETEVNTKRVVGTYGYMSPEYAMDGIFSMKSDVFSFGVLTLEIISGKKNRGVYHSTQNLNLLGYTWSLWKEGRGLELVDESIGNSFPKAEVLKCIKIGLLCVQERPEDRPTMSTVLLMLKGDNATIDHPRQPGFLAIRGPLETNSSSSKNDSLTINNISITTLEGR